MGAPETSEPSYAQTGHPDLRRGPWRALPATAPAAPGSARRTTSVDVARPDGLLGRCAVDVRGRDVVVGGDGGLQVVDEVAIIVDVDPARRVRGLRNLAGGPVPAQLGALAGASLRSGYGRLLAEALAGELERRTLLASVFEDLAAAFLVSGFAPLRAGLIPADPATAGAQAEHMADMCIGWAAAGPLHRVLAEEGRSAVPMGPPAPALERDEPAGWHELPELAPDTVRRRRSLDVAPASEGPGIAVRAHFRDSHAGDGPGDGEKAGDGDGADDGETVMHEYAVDAAVDTRAAGGGRITGIDVDPRVLPWEACPGAVLSADRVVGLTLAELPRRVRTDLVGASTCTHLTSTLRSLADARALTGIAGISGS